MQYWPNEKTSRFNFGAMIEMQAEIALHLIESFGIVAAKVEGEDSAGRAKLLLQEPEELVNRCFKIAELFITQAETKGLIKQPTISEEEKAAYNGDMENIRMEHSYSSKKKDAITS